MGREAEIRAIVEVGRRTRKPTPGWLWALALAMAVLGVAGFVVVMLADPVPQATALAVARRPVSGSGLGIGLTIGGVVGIVIGFAIARQRAAHSSRNNP